MYKNSSFVSLSIKELLNNRGTVTFDIEVRPNFLPLRHSSMKPRMK